MANNYFYGAMKTEYHNQTHNSEQSLPIISSTILQTQCYFEDKQQQSNHTPDFLL